MSENKLIMRQCANCAKWCDLSELEVCKDCENNVCENCFIERTDRCTFCDEEWLENHKEAY